MTLQNKQAYPKVCLDILDALKKGLSSSLTYHCLEHTLDVANVCNFYINHYEIESSIADLIRIAAISHDYGYIKSPINHEENSILLVKPYLSKLYSKEELKLISGMIRATKVPQNPHTLYEEILADADLDYLGRNDYDMWSNRLYLEFSHFGVVNSEKEWLAMQIQFLENHTYHTTLAKTNRDQAKIIKVEQLQDRLNKN